MVRGSAIDLCTRQDCKITSWEAGWARLPTFHGPFWEQRDTGRGTDDPSLYSQTRRQDHFDFCISWDSESPYSFLSAGGTTYVVDKRNTIFQITTGLWQSKNFQVPGSEHAKLHFDARTYLSPFNFELRSSTCLKRFQGQTEVAVPVSGYILCNQKNQQSQKLSAMSTFVSPLLFY